MHKALTLAVALAALLVSADSLREACPGLLALQAEQDDERSLLMERYRRMEFVAGHGSPTDTTVAQFALIAGAFEHDITALAVKQQLEQDALCR